MDIKHARTFVTVAESGTVSKAALQLRIAQPDPFPAPYKPVNPSDDKNQSGRDQRLQDAMAEIAPCDLIRRDTPAEPLIEDWKQQPCHSSGQCDPIWEPE